MLRPMLFAGTLLGAGCAGAAPPMPVTVTAYCVSGITKSGERTRPGIVAADPTVLPLGSVIRVEGLPPAYEGTYTVADTGAAVKGPIIDIYMKDCSAARRFGRQEAEVWVERHGPAE